MFHNDIKLSFSLKLRFNVLLQMNSTADCVERGEVGGPLIFFFFKVTSHCHLEALVCDGIEYSREENGKSRFPAGRLNRTHGSRDFL